MYPELKNASNNIFKQEIEPTISQSWDSQGHHLALSCIKKAIKFIQFVALGRHTAIMMSQAEIKRVNASLNPPRMKKTLLMFEHNKI